VSKATQISKVIRQRMLAFAQTVADSPHAGSVCVALSGGVDSCACLASLLEVGLKPTVVSYTPHTHNSTDFLMASQTAENLGLKFVPAIVRMEEDELVDLARTVARLGFGSKVQMESLTPMVRISREAKKAKQTALLTGDQSDGYFSLSRGASSGQGLKGELAPEMFPHKVTQDTDSRRIDANRRNYYAKDKSCSGAVAQVCDLVGITAGFPFRDKRIYEAFLGSLWSEVNRPRIKEPIKQAWSDYFTPDQIVTMKRQSNLHKGDSYFGDTFAAMMHTAFPGFNSNVGLYRALVRGEI
jgi:asparagine synthetase B (glutamine-hydrolysing)